MFRSTSDRAYVPHEDNIGMKTERDRENFDAVPFVAILIFKAWLLAASSACTRALFFLLTQKGLLLALRFFETCHKSAFLFGLGSVFPHCFANIIFVYNLAEYISLNYGDEQRQEVIIA